MKHVKMFGKSVPLLAIVLVGLLTLGASAALLTYYGYVEMTADVEQSIKIDGNVYSTPSTDDLGEVIGGSCYCYSHFIDNVGEKDAKITYSHTGNPAAEVQVKLLEEVHETLMLYDELYKEPANPGPGFTVTETWEGGNVIWDIELEDLPYSHTEFGLVIAFSNDKAAFQLGTGQMFGAGSPPIYQECGEDLGGPYGGWATTSPTHDLPEGMIVTNPGGSGEPGYGDILFHIEIPAKYLGGYGAEYYWAVTVAGNWEGGYGFTLYPDPTVWTRWSSRGIYQKNHVGTLLPNPFDLSAGAHLDFQICYDFTNEGYGLYDIETLFKP